MLYPGALRRSHHDAALTLAQVEENLKTWFALLLSVATAVALPFAAHAGPAPSVSVSLVCDRGVGTADVTITLLPYIGGTALGTATLSCGPDSFSGLRAERLRVVLTAPAGWVNVSVFAITTAAGTGGCPGGSVLPAKLTCQIGGTGPAATLTVR